MFSKTVVIPEDVENTSNQMFNSRASSHTTAYRLPIESFWNYIRETMLRRAIASHMLCVRQFIETLRFGQGRISSAQGFACAAVVISLVRCRALSYSSSCCSPSLPFSGLCLQDLGSGGAQINKYSTIQSLEMGVNGS